MRLSERRYEAEDVRCDRWTIYYLDFEPLFAVLRAIGVYAIGLFHRWGVIALMKSSGGHLQAEAEPSLHENQDRHGSFTLKGRRSSVIRASFVAAIFLLSCNAEVDPDPAPVLNTEAHERSDVPWQDSPVQADHRWRFLSSTKTGQGFQIKGAWEITLRNTSEDAVWVANVSRLSFHDINGFQVADYNPKVSRRYLAAGETLPLSGNFQFEIATIELANSITRMGVWASFRESPFD